MLIMVQKSYVQNSIYSITITPTFYMGNPQNFACLLITISRFTDC